MKSTYTLPPVRNIDAATLDLLHSRMPTASLALIVRAGLRLLAELDSKECIDAINKQAEREQVTHKAK